MKVFGTQLKRLRESRPVLDVILTQKELAAKIGVNQATITRWEKGIFKKNPRLESIDKLRKVYKVSAEYFFLNIDPSLEALLDLTQQLTHKMSFMDEERIEKIKKIVDDEFTNEINIQMNQPLRELYNPDRKSLSLRRDLFS